MQNNIKKIVILGPESTGKSTLCNELATHYKTMWAKEYAREYLEKNGTAYTFESLYEIAAGQLLNEEDTYKSLLKKDVAQSKIPFFIDTDLHVIKIWSEFVFNKCDNRILTTIAKKNYDLYLLCNIDLPWVKDNLREYPDIITRRNLFSYYKEEMIEQNTPWKIIKGSYSERLQNAINFIDEILK
jgi:NadR type nicotinamide-nucleotide adenylyltransferase